MYSLRNYGQMITESVRTDAYEQALRRAVKPGSVVLDLGTGTGIFALLACRFGARKVYAVEPDDVIQVAREIAAANGYGDRIAFHQALSTELNLPERADVIVFDLRGRLPLLQGNLGAIADARQRFLAPGGVLIPQRDELWTACVTAPDVYPKVTSPWSDNKYGLDMRAARRLEVNSRVPTEIQPGQLLSAPARFDILDYSAPEPSDLCTEVRLPIDAAGIGHGLCVWFDAILAEGIGFSNAPGRPTISVYRQTLFPWPEPVALQAGDVVAARFREDLVGGEYLWSWDTRILREDDPGQVLAEFKQSEFFSAPLSPAALRKQSASHVPALNDPGRIDHTILRMMADQIPLGDIARHLAAEYPARFPQWQDALPRVGELSLKYSK